MKAAVITISDRAFQGVYEDSSGKALIDILHAQGYETTYLLIPDDVQKLTRALQSVGSCQWVFTTGGTGLGPRDITPEVTADFCDKAIPGIAEFLRRESLKETPHAVFSRAYAGFKASTIVVNFPGSKKGAVFCLNLLLPLMQHGTSMLEGGGHP